MSLDSALLAAFFAGFLRTSAMVLAAPLFGGNGTPVIVRIFFAAALSLCLTPILYGQVSIPSDALSLLFFAGKEIACGLLIGVAVQFVLWAAEIAGNFLDMQVGFGLASVLVPNQSLPSTVISKFKFMLALVLLVTVNGHHLLVQALVTSYRAGDSITMATAFDQVLTGLGTMSLLAIQIAAPVAAVAFVVDASLGIVSRAVPQINILMVGIPGKLLAGIVAVGIALPALAAGVSRGVEIAAEALGKTFAG